MFDTSCYIWQRNPEPTRADLSVYGENPEAQNPGRAAAIYGYKGLKGLLN